MRLTMQTDYALRMLIFLAAQSGPRRIEEVAAHYDISANHLMKVAQRLSSAGFIESKRGRGGGLRLARPVIQINVGAVVREMEEVDQLVECQTANNQCLLTPVCGLKNMFRGAAEAFLRHLDQFNLGQAIGNPSALTRLFENAS